MRTQTTIALLSMILILIACEKVVVIDLNISNQQIVVEAELFMRKADSYVKLSKTGSFYEDDEFETIQNATIKVIGSNGDESSFIEDAVEPGTYIPDRNKPFFSAIPGVSYTLSIDIPEGDGTITSVSTAPTRVPLDSITIEYLEGGFGRERFLIRLHFTDPPGEENFYRVREYWNNSTGETFGFFVFSDELFDGTTTDYPMFRIFPREGDGITVDLICIDKANYLYLKGLEAIHDQGPFSASPGNPLSNIEGIDAIGYFSASSQTRQSIVVTK